uniref:Glycosyl transferase CAP10 domain-containing protein n=1 Tax=Meleagris gallopavo TaxID=9103 RepID=A0A803YH59_MELGA
MDSGIECILSNFADDTKLSGAVDTLEGRDAIKGDMNRFRRWAHTNLMKFNKAKCKVVHLSRSKSKRRYKLGGEWFEGSTEEKDLGVSVKMPDVEFFVNLGDWPLEKKKPPQNLHPIFSWCGSSESKDIVMPTYDLTDSVLETMGRVSLDMMSVQANTGPSWEDKNTTAFWRGRDSRKERLELVKLSRKYPEIIDAAFTNFFFFKHDENLYGPIVKHISFFDFFKYKYQINIDGTVAAYRLPYLLAGNSVVLKQDSIYYEHFYNELQPWKHYIPFKSDLSDLLEKLQWAKEHDEEAKKIAKSGQEFARNNLMGDHIFCYYFKLFQEYSSLQVSEPKIRDGMEKVQQPEDDLFPCTCHRKKTKDEL